MKRSPVVFTAWNLILNWTPRHFEHFRCCWLLSSSCPASSWSSPAPALESTHQIYQSESLTRCREKENENIFMISGSSILFSSSLQKSRKRTAWDSVWTTPARRTPSAATTSTLWIERMRFTSLNTRFSKKKGDPLKVKFVLFYPYQVKQTAKEYLGCRRHEKRPELGQTSRRADHSQTIYQQLSSTSALEGIFLPAVLFNKVQENGKDRNIRPKIKPR